MKWPKVLFISLNFTHIAFYKNKTTNGRPTHGESLFIDLQYMVRKVEGGE